MGITERPVATPRAVLTMKNLQKQVRGSQPPSGTTAIQMYMDVSTYRDFDRKTGRFLETTTGAMSVDLHRRISIEIRLPIKSEVLKRLRKS